MKKLHDKAMLFDWYFMGFLIEIAIITKHLLVSFHTKQK